MFSNKTSLSRLPLIGVILFTCNAVAKQQVEEITVTAHPLSKDGFAQSVAVLRGEELYEKVQSSLGETIAGQAGIQSASFGVAVARPVIHGLGGGRIKTTEDRIDSLDVSVTSADHAVTIEPFIANQISILKGASTLIYGSGAIGGVVDVETGRLPKSMPKNGLSGRVELRASDNADARTGAVRLDGALSENLVWHIDGFSRDADDYEIPGFAESSAFRALEEAEHEEEEHHEEEHGHEDEVQGVLEGSRNKNKGGAIGFSWIGKRGFAGVSISKLDADYGLVGGHEHGEEEGSGMIDLQQTRVDFEAQLNDPFAGFEKANFRLGVNDYEHKEIEPNGEVATVFDNQAWEARLEFTHYEMAGFTGTFGLQLSNREFSALGEEAFVPPVDSDTQGAFWVLERDYDSFSIEGGVRYDRVEHKPTAGQPALDFSTGSASLGVVVPVSKNLTISALLDYSGRAPTVEELYSYGAHLATQSYELGDTSLDKESALGMTLTLSYESDLFDAGITLYHTSFDDFIYEANRGDEIDGLPVFVYQQNDATFTGIDAKAGVHLFHLADSDVDLTFLFDTVKAELDISGNDNLPRIPATRFGAGLKWSNEQWTAKLDYLHVSEQDDVAPFELATPSYDDVSLYLAKRVELAGNQLSVFLHGRNLTDEEQRHHVSFVKDLAPAPGRRFEVGIRYQF